MEFNSSIVGWIAGLLFVYIFGLYEGRNQGYKRRKKEEEQEKKDLPPPAPETVTLTVDDPGLLRIKNEDGSFVLDLDGARVNPISLLPEQRKRLIEILSIMRPWLEGRPAPASQQSALSPSTSLSQSTPLAWTPGRPAPVSPAPPPRSPSQPIETAQSRPATQKPSVIAPEDRPAAPANSI